MTELSRPVGLAALLLLWAAAPVWSQIVVSPETVTAGAPVTLWMKGIGGPVGDVPMTVIYRPGSQVEGRVELGRTADTGALVWVPASPGLVRVVAELPESGSTAQATHVRDIAVRFAVVPGSGLGTLIAAGVLLFGGVAVGLRRTLLQ